MSQQRRPKRGLAVWLTSTRLPVFVLDERRVILMFNRGCEELTGWAAGDVIGKQCDYAVVGEPGSLVSLTGILAPPPAVYDGNCCLERLPVVSQAGTSQASQIHFLPLGQVEHDSRYRVLGIITPDSSDLTCEAHTDGNWRSPLGAVLEQTRQRFGLPLIAHASATQRVAAQVRLAQSASVSVLVHGPAGSGKEYIARQIHYGSPSAEKAFVPLDCRMSATEIELVLNRVFEFPDRQPGVLCLKHVDALPMEYQRRLLDILAEDRPCPRLLATSDSATVQQQLAKELWNRLTTITIELPSLEQRREDLPALAQQLLEQCNIGQSKQVTGFTPDVRELLTTYHWPRQIRELAGVIHTAWERCTGTVIGRDNLPFDFLARHQADDLPPQPRFPPLDSYLEECERELILEALELANGNKTLVADWLHVPRAKLYRRMESLKLEVSEAGISIEREGDA